VVAVWLLLACGLRAAEPLYEQDPFDCITLNAANQNTVLKVRPLDFPNRQIPPKPPTKLVVRLVDEPDQDYEVQWAAIAKLDLFEDMVLGEGRRLVKDGQLDDAYDYFKYLEDKNPKQPGLREAIEEYLYEEAKTLQLRKQYPGALAMLRELHRRDPQRAGLDKALGVATEKQVELYVAADNYPAARQLLRHLAELYPQLDVVTRWEGQLKSQATALLAEGRQAQAAGKLRQAHQAAQRLTILWPALPGAKEFAQAVHQQFPRVVVGVSEPAVAMEPGRLNDWAARRSSRLAYRTLMEFVGPGPEGGEYQSPLGKMSIQELGLRLIFELKPGMHWSTGNATLTGYDLSRRLLAMADPQDDAYRFDWGEMLGSVSVPRVYTVEADLRRPHVRPQALLQATVVPYSDPSIPDPLHSANGPYAADTRGDTETIYVANTQYFAAGPTQPKEIVERHYRAGQEAIAALRHRQIDVLDRVNPWDLDKLMSNKQLVVERYAVPLVHCLVPNTRKPVLANSNFRRALVYGINRSAILNRLLDGKQREGCRVISGPFSAGILDNDPLDYAYDESIEPRPYDPRLAIALSQVGFHEAAEAVKRQGGELKAMPKLVLGYPPQEIARLAATSIQRQLAALSIPLVLKELPPGAPPRVPDDVDLLYVELAMWEPVVDARRLLDQDGIAGACSPYMSLALRQLEQASTWPEVGSRLRQIHKIAHTEVAVVPLWQLTDHFAYHRSLAGVGAKAVTLYQNIEQWQPAFNYPAEEP
jgi:ABC-type transport system substrate-binding protein